MPLPFAWSVLAGSLPEVPLNFLMFFLNPWGAITLQGTNLPFNAST